MRDGWADGTLEVAPGGADVTLADGTSATAEPLAQDRTARAPDAVSRGLTSEQLGAALQGDRGKPVTIRAEVSRLRRVLGDALRSRPLPARRPGPWAQRLRRSEDEPELPPAWQPVRQSG